MNNLDYLRSLSAEELAKTVKGVCTTCAFYGERCRTETELTCSDGFVKWLYKEYYEPNSWESLLADLDRVSDKHTYPVCRYFNEHEPKTTYYDCDKCRSERDGILGTCITNMVVDIASRIRELLGKDSDVLTEGGE